MNRSITSILSRGLSEIITARRVEAKLASGKNQRIKYGIDPTSPSFHLGHTVPLRKLREFQNLGHIAVFIIGDFTAQIGDPVGKNDTRTMLTLKETQANASAFSRLASRFLDMKKAEVHFQSEWYNTMTLEQTIRLMATVTKEQLMRHETFRMREKQMKPLGFHEMFYTLLMAFDSVAVKADIELGGPDQKFNFLMTRQVMKKFGLPPQDALLLQYLPGTDGAEKMSKSANNFVGIDEDPSVQFEKIMKIQDKDIAAFFDLVTDLSTEEVGAIAGNLASGTLHPIAAKRRLAIIIVTDCHSAQEALTAERRFFDAHKQLQSMI